MEWRLSPAPKPETRRRLKRRWGSCAPRIAKGNALGSGTPDLTGCKVRLVQGSGGVAHATRNCALVPNLPLGAVSNVWSSRRHQGLNATFADKGSASA